ncbi:OsmC family peroxiredoxin [Rubrobacter calidifluminis]|uniref:OsmC family peroxiredoxin n=1 Tax=Rubrobacter calidifluminis TaxID=1392640 RepID=UPI00235F5AA0|nr:OsmC family peroxiredoxin [Rubrobacter calidifluminis]
MPSAQRRAEVRWRGSLTGGSGSLNLASSGALSDAQISFPARTGDPDGKTSPEELIAAAHAGCYAMALSNVLSESGHEPEELEVSAEVTFDMGQLKITSSVLEVRGRVPGLDEAGFREAAEKAEQGCPVSNALRNNVEITLNASLA